MSQKRSNQVSHSIIREIEEHERMILLGQWIRQELDYACRLGLERTPLRPFMFNEEALGAMRCCNSKCKNASMYVTYLTGIQGRQAFCSDCALIAMREQMEK